MTAIEDGASQEGVHRDSLGDVQERSYRNPT
jgi:hypothetical protein